MDKFLGIATEPETDRIPKASNTIGVANRQKPVKQGRPTRGPRATCGPPKLSKWPVKLSALVN